MSEHRQAHHHHHHHHDEPAEPQPLLLAVAGQNGPTVTPHAGKTRRSVLFTADAAGTVEEAGRDEPPKAMTLHGWPRARPHPLLCVDVVVVGSASEPFEQKLARLAVRVLVLSVVPVAEAAARAAALVLAPQ